MQSEAHKKITETNIRLPVVQVVHSTEHYPDLFSEHHPDLFSEHHPDVFSEHHPDIFSEHHTDVFSEHQSDLFSKKGNICHEIVKLCNLCVCHV